MFSFIKSLFYKIKYIYNDKLNNSKKYRYDSKRIIYNNIRTYSIPRYSTPCTFYQENFYDYIENNK